MIKSISWRLTIACCSIGAIVGCSGSTAFFKDPTAVVRDPGRMIGRPRGEKNIVKIVSLWESSSGTGVDDKPCRGFAGQILFFGPHNDTAVRVRGTVKIYEYDEYDSEWSEDLVPLHTFAFDNTAWAAHLREGTIGESYSCFIPYMRKHKDQVNCGLRVEFIPDGGRPVKSEITEVLLTSKTSAALAAEKTRGFVRESQLNFAKASKGTPEFAPEAEEDKLETLSIPLPKK